MMTFLYFLTCNMLGLGGWGVMKNQSTEAKLSQVVATSYGHSRRMFASLNTALEKAL